MRAPDDGLKPVLRELEDILFDQALYLHSNKDPGFAASDKWLAGSMSRFGLSYRYTTNLTVLDDEDLTDRAMRYMAYLSDVEPNMDFSCTALMDETLVCFEGPIRQTVDLTGAYHVALRSTGFASWQVTVVFAVSALGKGKCLVWDSVRAHISRAMKAKCATEQVSICVIPGGLAAYLQAGNIGIYSSFKEKLSSLNDTWKGSEYVNYTTGGNSRPPTIEVVPCWVALAWKNVPDTVVQKSVAAAGFSNKYA